MDSGSFLFQFSADFAIYIMEKIVSSIGGSVYYFFSYFYSERGIFNET